MPERPFESLRGEKGPPSVPAALCFYLCADGVSRSQLEIQPKGSTQGSKHTLESTRMAFNDHLSIVPPEALLPFRLFQTIALA